eukprot:4393432-Pyramimonas_sp.AAC.1
MASYAIYFTSWKLNSISWMHLLCSPGYCPRPCSPQARSLSIARYHRIAPGLDGNQQCSLPTCPGPRAAGGKVGPFL